MMVVNHPSEHRRRGFSLVGLLISMACIVVLMVILMTAANNAITGSGAAKSGTVYSTVDQTLLYAQYTGLSVYATEQNGAFPVPSELSGSGDVTQNTTAAFWSSMVMGNYVDTSTLISANEFNGWVEEMTNYNRTAYDPRAGIYWDPNFKADLRNGSHTSFAHIPLHGERFERNWHNSGTNWMPIVGTRGPLNGKHDPNSLTYGDGGVWGGHILCVDGSIHFLDSFYAPNVYLPADADGERNEDNIYAFELGIDGADALLSFTSQMDREGPFLQHD